MRLFLEILLIPIPIKLAMKVAQIDIYIFFMTSENVTMGGIESLSLESFTHKFVPWVLGETQFHFLEARVLWGEKNETPR